MAGEVVLPPSSTKEPSGEVPPMSREVKLALAAIFAKGYLDIIGNYSIMPALVFYVRELGGNDSQYGLISAAASLAACFMMPVYASIVDNSGNKFRKPLLVGFSLAILGMLLYTIAVLFPIGDFAVHVLLASRLVYGIGSASGSIVVSYITCMVAPEQLTSVIVNLGIVSYFGLGVAPYVNMYLADVNTSINFLGSEIPLNPFNSVGLLIAFFELVAMLLVYFLLPEPPEKDGASDDAAEGEEKLEDGGWVAVFKELATDVKLFLPVFAIFVSQSSYQMIEIAFPAAALHGLGWGPVAVSATLSWCSFSLGASTMATTILTNKYQVTDSTLIVTGFACWAVGGIATYTLWTYPANEVLFVIPIVIGFFGYAMIGPANQANYYKATMSRDELEPIQTRLQSILGMIGEIANFVTPLFVGSFVLRSPDVVEGGTNVHELTALSLYIPLFASFCIIGFLYEKIVLHFGDEDEDDEEEEDEDEAIVATETTSLVKGGKRKVSLATIAKRVSSESEATRIRNACMTGGSQPLQVLVPFETPKDEKRRLKMLKTKKRWEEVIAKAKAAEAASTAA